MSFWFGNDLQSWWIFHMSVCWRVPLKFTSSVYSLMAESMLHFQTPESLNCSLPILGCPKLQGTTKPRRERLTVAVLGVSSFLRALPQAIFWIKTSAEVLPIHLTMWKAWLLCRGSAPSGMKPSNTDPFQRILSIKRCRQSHLVSELGISIHFYSFLIFLWPFSGNQARHKWVF